MLNYIIRRLLFGVVLIFLSTIVSFAILRAAPGKPGATDFDPRVSAEFQEQRLRTFGYDRHPVRQYLDWVGVGWFFPDEDGRRFEGLLQGSLGQSTKYNQPVAEVIPAPLGATLALNIGALMIGWLVAVPLGIIAAVKYQKVTDKALSLLGFLGMSAPGFFLALLLLWIFALKVDWIPPGGLRSLDHTTYLDRVRQVDVYESQAAEEGRALTDYEQRQVTALREEAQAARDRLGPGGRLADYARHLILPVVVLTFASLASLQRVMRGSMIETLRQQYIVTARAKGVSGLLVLYKHAVRNAINPLVTLLGLEFAVLFTGAAILENIISYPGMGSLILEALRAKDQALVMASFLIGSVMLVLGNLLAEVLLAVVDPRVSYE